MIPFVVVGGLLQALGLLLDGRDLARDPAAVLTGALLHAPSGGAGQHTAAVLYTLGTLSFHSWLPYSPDTSRTRSPAGPASCPASPRAWPRA